MKKLFILAIGVLGTVSSFAQRNMHLYPQSINCSGQDQITGDNAGSIARTSGTGSNYTLSNISDTAALVLYTAGADSGYVTGTDIWNDQAFAERYDFNGHGDSSLQVIGVYAQFGGTVNPASVDSVVFDIWDLNPVMQMVSDSLLYSPFPNNLLTSVSVPFTQLGIGVTDTLKIHMFPTPYTVSGPFFAGYNINYNFAGLNGDNIGLACSRNGSRTSAKSSLSVTFSYGDTIVNTIVNVQNATLGSDNNWYDNYTQANGLFNDLAIYPIVVVANPTGIKGITRNDLTLFGNYPNPAANNTNIRFSLAGNADVSIQITDMSGRVINMIRTENTSAGEHIVPVNTADMPAGDYLYLVRTSQGGGMAGKMTVLR